jgi:hypothetical protein
MIGKLTMRNRRWLALAAVLLLLALFVPSATAQTYSFSVPEMKMQVYIQPDASARIIYDITFKNNAYAYPIDIVDIGTPHEGYDISNMKASIDNVALNIIRPSEYVKPGVEIHLGNRSIAASRQGTLHFEFTMPDMVYQDTTRGDYASLQITPTWFDKKFVTGSSDIQIAIHMLPDIKPEEMLYQKTPFTDKAIFEGHSVALWRWQNGSATGPHLVGISFPKRGMSRVIQQTILDLLLKWFKDNPDARFIAGAVFFLLFGFLFFRFTGGTGISVFVLLSAGLIWLFVVSPAAHLFSFLPLVASILLFESRRWWRRKNYLPAFAQVEGGGIKRGLTAPEAAVLLEMPLNKVLTLVIFGLLKKGILRQVRATPLVVEVADEFRAPKGERRAEALSQQRRKAAQEKGTVLHSYEEPFLNALEWNAGRPVAEIDFGSAMRKLVESVAGKVKNFDLSDTQDYYRQIIRRALQEAQAIGEIEEREKVIDRNFEWILLDDDYPTVFGPQRGYNYQPVWTRPIFVGGHGTAAPAPSAAPGVPAPGGRSTFGDVAASFAGWAENTMGSMASAISPGSLQVPGTHGGVIDLSGADVVTGDIFEALAEAAAKSATSGGGGGGGGCACAGCACACACAGGGR